jgi:hypothetical protein
MYFRFRNDCARANLSSVEVKVVVTNESGGGWGR